MRRGVESAGKNDAVEGYEGELMKTASRVKRERRGGDEMKKKDEEKREERRGRKRSGSVNE